MEIPEIVLQVKQHMESLTVAEQTGVEDKVREQLENLLNLLNDELVGDAPADPSAGPVDDET